MLVTKNYRSKQKKIGRFYGPTELKKKKRLKDLQRHLNVSD